jgi:hypothetical protein
MFLVLKKMIRRQCEKNGDGNGDGTRNAQATQDAKGGDGGQGIAGEIEEIGRDGPVSGDQAKQFQRGQMEQIAIG